MNNKLIERTSRAIASCRGDAPILKAVLLDCKAEIELLSTENANMAEHVRKVQANRDEEIQPLLLANETLKELNVEYLNRVKILETELWRDSKAKEYTPMTRSELCDANGWKHYELNEYELGLVRKGESTTIKRAGLKVKDND